MLRNVFLKTLWDQRRSLVWWAVGVIALAAYTAGLYPSMSNSDITNYVKSLPPALTALFGESFSLTTIQGYLNAYFFDMMGPILFVIYAIAAGSSAIAGEEDRGTLDVLLAAPVHRWAVVLHKFAAMVVGTLLIGVFLWLGLVFTMAFVNLKVDAGRLGEATLASVMVGLVFGGLALALGSIRGSRGFSIGVSAAVTIVAYMLKTYAPLVEAMKPYQKLSPFYYANAAKPLVNGLDLGHTALMAGVTLVLLAVALVAFQRRDVAV